MSFAIGFHQHIEKAKRPPWRRTRTFHRLDALHRRMGAVVGADLSTGVQAFKKRIEPQRVYEAWLSGDWAKVLQSVPWDKLSDDLAPAFERNGESLVGAWRETIPSLPAPVQRYLRVDTKNPRIREFINGRTRKNFVALSQDSVDNIHTWVRASMNKALSPRDVANGIKNSIGLLPAHAIAVRRFTEDLRAKGYPAHNFMTQGAAYADRLLDYRAMMIGRTETRLATNWGQLDVWRHAGDMGLIDKAKAKKVWRVDGDPCEICAPMEGVAVPLDSSWSLPNGASVDVPPDGSHPNCFCGMDIVTE